MVVIAILCFIAGFEAGVLLMGWAHDTVKEYEERSKW